MAMENQSCHLLPPGHVHGLLTINLFFALFGTAAIVFIILTVRRTETLQIHIKLLAFKLGHGHVMILIWNHKLSLLFS